MVCTVTFPLRFVVFTKLKHVTPPKTAADSATGGDGELYGLIADDPQYKHEMSCLNCGLFYTLCGLFLLPDYRHQVSIRFFFFFFCWTERLGMKGMGGDERSQCFFFCFTTNTGDF